MERQSIRRTLRQRLVALALAYAVALSGFLASHGLARAAGAAAIFGGVICHAVNDADQAPLPASDQADHCADNCCLGCITLLAALPPPPVTAATLLWSPGRRLPPPIQVALAIRPETASHQSRAPPSPA